MHSRKLLFLCHGAGNGGAERVITTLASEFAAREYDVMLVTTNESNNDYELHPLVQRRIIISSASNVLLRTVDRIYLLRKCIKSFTPDCIISFSTISNMQAIVANIGLKNGLIISERTDPSRYPTSRLGRFARLILYRFADRIVFQTPDAMNYFKGKILSLGTIISNPIRNDIPDPYKGKRKYKIIGVGSLGEQKNWPVAFKACSLFFSDFPEYTMDIYGEGPDRTYLQDIIDHDELLKERIVLKGFSSNAVSEMRTARMYLSSSNYEGISNSMLEALAMGVPTICTDCPVGGARMFIHHGKNGLLVPVGDSKKMADAMRCLATDDELCDMFSEKSIDIRQQLALTSIVDKWEREILLLC